MKILSRATLVEHLLRRGEPDMRGKCADVAACVADGEAFKRAAP